MPNSSNSSLVESVYNLNARYFETLLPLTFIYGFIAFAGLLGNTVVLVVFSTGHEYKNTNFKVYALFHAVIDLFTCITVIPGEIYNLGHYFAFHNGNACKVFCFFNTFGAGATALMLMLISVERFLRVTRPLGTQIQPRLAVRLCVLCIFVALMLACPAALMCGAEEASITNVHGRDTTIHICLAEEKFKNSVWRVVYKLVLVILTGFVLVICIVMYVIIWRTVFAATRMRMGHEAYGMRRKKTVKQREAKMMFIEGREDAEDCKRALSPEDLNTASKCQSEILQNETSLSTDSDSIGQFPYKTVIWFVLTVIFIATHIVYGTLSLFKYAILSLPPKLFTLASFFNRLYFVNSVINPFVYALLDSRFRRTCRRLFEKRFV
ncbi:hypothetical protein ACJMK2_038377 [Sinanodonta woodiana]|uniref:G-protein coupled receptors family 1 profile domain-containing protein n=1 Tax=Sinanodonta woodiana TaxID=1069815 RepID=A0ABD3W9N4_SINWO